MKKNFLNINCRSGIASLIKFWDNSDKKKAFFTSHARNKFPPISQTGVFLANMTGHNYISVTGFLQFSPSFNNKKIFQKSL